MIHIIFSSTDLCYTLYAGLMHYCMYLTLIFMTLTSISTLIVWLYIIIMSST